MFEMFETSLEILHPLSIGHHHWCLKYRKKYPLAKSPQSKENNLMHVIWKNLHYHDIGSYFKTSSSFGVRWGLLSPVLPPGVDSPEDLRERSLTPLVSDVGPNVEVPGLFKIPFIASALRRNDCNSHALCSSLL